MRNLVLIGICAIMIVATPAQAVVSTINSANDGEIDQHVNWNGDPKGVPGTWTDAEYMNIGRLGEDYSDPVIGPQKWGLMTFDTSGIPATDKVWQATLKLIQMDNVSQGGRRDLTYRTAVYGINSGVYLENTTSWNNWVGMAGNSSYNPVDDYLASGDVSFLGYMGNEPDLHDTGALCVFNDADLIALVQDWVDGNKDNLGLMLRWADDGGVAPPAGTDMWATYANHENPTLNGPQLVINHVPEPATLSLLVLGGLALIRRRK